MTSSSLCTVDCIQWINWRNSPAVKKMVPNYLLESYVFFFFFSSYPWKVFLEEIAQISRLQRVNVRTIKPLLYLANYITLQHMSLAQLFNSSFPKVIGPEAGCCCTSAPVILTFHAFFRKEKLIECEKSGTLTGCQNILQHKPTCQPACFLVYFKVS